MSCLHYSAEIFNTRVMLKCHETLAVYTSVLKKTGVEWSKNMEKREWWWGVGGGVDA